MKPTSIGSFSVGLVTMLGCLLSLDAPAFAVDYNALHGFRLGESSDEVRAVIGDPARTKADQAQQANEARRRPYRCSPNWTPEHCAEIQARIAARGSDVRVDVPSSYLQKPCLHSDNGSAQKYDSSVGFDDAKLQVSILFNENAHVRPCQGVVTSVATYQILDVTTDASLHAVEERFIKDATAKYGRPTYFAPRHKETYVEHHNLDNAFNQYFDGSAPQGPSVEKREIQPYLAWCNTGSARRCKDDDAPVDRRLFLTFDYTQDGKWIAEVVLADLTARRREAARQNNASADRNKPSL